MSSGSENPKVLLDRLAEFMADQTEEMSDEELLEETGEITDAELFQVQSLRRRLEEKAGAARRQRLEQARAKYEATLARRHTGSPAMRLPIAEVKRRIEEAFTNCGEVPLALAFRNGEYQSEQDLMSLWQQLCELGVVGDSTQ